VDNLEKRDYQLVAERSFGDTKGRFKAVFKDDVSLTAVLFHKFSKNLTLKSAHTIKPLEAAKNPRDFAQTYKFGLAFEFTY